MVPTKSPPDQYAVLGNPPFGYRAWLALAFINHSAIFADYIGFILPMAFQSDGKGSPKFRVKGAELILSTRLPSNAFVDMSEIQLSSIRFGKYGDVVLIVRKQPRLVMIG